MLHARRQRLKDIAAREAAGESLWTEKFDQTARARIWVILLARIRGVAYYDNVAANSVKSRFLAELGISLPEHSGTGYERLRSWLHELDDSLVPSFLEALFGVVSTGSDDPDELNDVLNEHRIAFEMINGEMVEFESKELHQEVVAPTLRLLSGRPGWDKVESAYQDALREISQNKPGDAITDAATALQAAFVVLGCTGNSLGPLAKDARKKGLLAPHDDTLNEALQKIVDWVSADRSETGDAHKASTATREDAWFVVHVVGALILRLAGGPPRA